MEIGRLWATFCKRLVWELKKYLTYLLRAHQVTPRNPPRYYNADRPRETATELAAAVIAQCNR